MTQSNILMKTDTSENWAKCEDKYIPVEHTIIAYADADRPIRYKFSDGINFLRDLPFVVFTQEKIPSVENEILTY